MESGESHRLERAAKEGVDREANTGVNVAGCERSIPTDRRMCLMVLVWSFFPLMFLLLCY